MTPVLTLRHLSILSGTSYYYLRQIVSHYLTNQYKIITLKKRVPGRSARRMICIPSKSLMRVLRWIAQNILSFTTAHEASFAFHPGSRPMDAIEQHLESEWLRKVDLQDFFHSIKERDVCRIFAELGYGRLISFEMARLVTIPVDRGRPWDGAESRWTAIRQYQSPAEGMLPQGAPTSPMLSNLAFRRTDVRLAALASAQGFRYSRYADDLAFSSPNGKALNDVKQFRETVLGVLNEAGFRPNLRKTVIRGPGSRRIVLGVLVNSSEARLTREFKDGLRLHLYYLGSPEHGPAAHAASRNTSISSLYHHVRGLISWAESVEPKYAAKMLHSFNAVKWPPVQPRSIPEVDWS